MDKEELLLSDWYLVKQPIYYFSDNSIKADDKQVIFYELLLRSQATDRFPAREFNELIKTKQGNYHLFSWLQEKLLNLFKTNQQIVVSVNIEPVQLLDHGMLFFLKALAPYKHQVVIEITERLPKTLALNDFIDVLAEIDNQGFYILLDDVDILVDHTKLLANISKYVKGFKLSPIALNSEHDGKFIKLISHLKNFKSYKIIGEGTSDSQICDKYLKLGITYQQGWYLGREELV